MTSIIVRQFEQISSGGIPVILRKLYRISLVFCKTPIYLLAFFLVLMIRLFSPIAIVRLGMLDVGRIGGIIYGDWYLSQKADGLHLGRYLDFFYFVKSTKHVNKQWIKMWKKSIPTLAGSEIWNSVIRFNKLFPGYEKYEIPDTHVYPAMRDWSPQITDKFSGKIYKDDKLLNAVIKNKKANISFSLEEQERGQRVLEELKIPKDKDYICFHARDAAYLDAVNNNLDWNYHNFRDSSIQNYVLAAEEMTNRGYCAVRMGAIVKEPVKTFNPSIIDYASNGMRTDFNDVYIGSHCRFFLCSDGGISSIPEMLRIPAVYVNWTPLLRISTWVLNGLFIFKKFYLKDENRNLSFSEIMNLEFGGFDTNEIFSKLNLELIENTPEEIRAVTIEMDKRLNGTWQTTEDDAELQERFWALFGPDKLKSPDLRIGAQYLRDNQELLK